MSDDKKKTILLAGCNGELGTKIKEQLDPKHFEITGYDQTEFEKNTMPTGTFDIGIVSTSPKTHPDNIQHLQQHCNKVLVEKPNPILPLHPSKKVFYIDHYLYKANINDSVIFFKENKNDIQKIEINICEKTFESRNWMLSSEKQGGVILDLAHHAVAILLKLFEKKIPIEKLSLEDLSQFNENTRASESFAFFKFTIDNILVELKVGKQCPIFQKNIVFHLDQSIRVFDLNDSVNYSQIVTSFNTKTNKILSHNDIIIINETLQKLSHTAANFQPVKKKSSDKQLEVLSDLFKHRHLYYWNTFYKLTMYCLFIIVAPYIGDYYQNISVSNNPTLEKLPSYTMLLFSFAAFLVNLYLTKQFGIFLASENDRVLQSSARLRDLLSSSNINLNIKTRKTIGNHMESVFKVFILSISFIGIIIGAYRTNHLAGISSVIVGIIFIVMSLYPFIPSKVKKQLINALKHLRLA